MAKTSKKKAKAKSPTGKRNTLPRPTSDQIAELNRPLGFDVIPKFADRLVAFLTVLAGWKEAGRKHFADGGKAADLPELPTSKMPNINSGRMSQSAYDKLLDQYNEAAESGDALPAIPPRYCPVEQDLIAAIGCSVIRKGQATKPPKGWDEKKFGPWYHEDVDGERTVKSGWLIDDKPQRQCHAAIRSMVTDPKDNILTIGGTEYVVGTGGNEGSAMFLLNAHRPGNNYGANHDVIKRMSLAGVKGLANIVFRIETKPNDGACIRVDMTGNKEFNYFMPGDVATPGFLTNGGGKELTPAQIRKAAEGDGKGIKFKAIKDHVVGQAIVYSEMWSDIRKGSGKAHQAMRDRPSNLETAKTPQVKSQDNATVECRVNHTEGYPFGFRSAQIGVVPFFEWELDENEKWVQRFGMVIGARNNFEYNITKNEAKANLADEAEEVEEVVETPKPKRKSSKKKTTDEAAPVEADTADDSEQVEDEAAVAATE
jgi:hypothetical protein